MHVAAIVRSYRDLPMILYHFQIKERDEPRPRAGVLRTREFIMKDSYTFDRDAEGLDVGYGKHVEAYDRIFDRARARVVPRRVRRRDDGRLRRARVHGAVPGGRERRRARARLRGERRGRERRRRSRSSCRRRSSAARRRHAGPDDDRAGRRRARRAARAAAQGAPGDRRGPRARRGLRARRPPRQRDQAAQRAAATTSARRARTSSRAVGPAGFLGPVGRRRPDPARRRGRARRATSPARNEPDLHLAASSPAATSRRARRRAHASRRATPSTGTRSASSPRSRSATSSSSARATPSRSARPTSTRTARSSSIWMGSYGIGPARIAAAAVEQFADEHGISWPRSLAPWDVHVVAPRQARAPTSAALAEELYGELQEPASTCCSTTATPAPGEKFADAELLGCPAAPDRRQALARVRRGRGAGAARARGAARCRSRASRRRRRELWRDRP